MDASASLKLLEKDTSYLPRAWKWRLDYTYIVNGRAVHCSTKAEDDRRSGIFSGPISGSRLTVVHIRQKRHYLSRDTVSAISIDPATWFNVLQHFQVLPNFLELLHSNNGATLAWISYSEHGKGVREPIAFHVGYKMGDWANDEVAVYARRDLQTGRSFVLILGTEECLCREQICEALSRDATLTAFHIVFIVQSATLALAERIRWQMDYRTQELEGDTGVTTLRQRQANPLAPEQLRFNRNLQVATDFTRNVAWGSERIRLNFEALLSHLSQYSEICPPGSAHALPQDVLQNLTQACELKRSLARHQFDQIQCLLARLRSQAEITKTLMAERDTQISIDIAQATRRDSELMRGIAAVTMIFLPATFVATFFSMVFFHVGDEREVRLIIDRKIWLYPVVTVPLTACIAMWYLAWSLGLPWKRVRAWLESVWK